MPIGETETGVWFEVDDKFQYAIGRVVGRLDDMLAAALQSNATSAIDQGLRDIILDMEAVSAATPAGLAALSKCLDCIDGAHGRIALVGCQAPVADALQLSGLCRRLLLFPDIQTARQQLFGRYSAEFAAAPENGAGLRLWLKEILTRCGATPTEMECIEAAASEAFVNAVQHAANGPSSRIQVHAVVGSAVTIEIHDDGPGFEARQYIAADPSVPNTSAVGLGIYLMRSLMDQVEFIAGSPGHSDLPPGTTVRLVKRLAQSPHPRRRV